MPVLEENPSSTTACVFYSFMVPLFVLEVLEVGLQMDIRLSESSDTQKAGFET